MSPAEFATRCQQIRDTLSGHAAHREFDRLCEEALRAAGYGEGVAIFESGVKHWHNDGDSYPYPQACPDCRQ